MEKGADINKEDDNGITPMLNAFLHRYKNIVNYLVKHGADINILFGDDDDDDDDGYDGFDYHMY